MNQRETDTSEQVLKFAPKEKAPNRVAQLDDAGQAIVAQIRTAADLAKEDCDRAMSSCTQAFHGTQSGRRPYPANGEGGRALARPSGPRRTMASDDPARD